MIRYQIVLFIVFARLKKNVLVLQYNTPYWSKNYLYTFFLS